MVKRPRGPRNKSRKKMTKSAREKGLPSVNAFLKPLEIGQVVAIDIEPAVKAGMPPIRFQGLSGKIIGKKGRDGLVVEFKDKGKVKKLVTCSVHLKCQAEQK